MKLSPHFTLEEFEFSQVAERQNLNNRVPTRLVPRLVTLCETLLEPIRERFGPVQVSSGYRAPLVNCAVGGSLNSQHIEAEAADIVIPGVEPIEVCRVIADELQLPFHQLIHEFGRWTHISIAPAGRGPRRQILTIDRHGTQDGLHPVRR